MSATAYETLTCNHCQEDFQRVVTRGRKPQYCENCRRLGSPLQAPAAPAFRKVEPIRDSGKRFHYAFSTLLAVAASRVPAMLVGPAGSGKSTAGRQVAENLGLSFKSESCNPQMSKWDIMGFNNAQGGYTPGVVYKPFKEGGVVLLDEIDASNPAVLVSINLIASVSVGETVTFPNGEDVARHEDFILIAGANTFGDGASDEYVGREQLDAATLDRFATIEWGYDEALERIAAGAGAEEWVSYVQSVRKAAAAAGVSLLVTPRASINGANLLRAGLSRTQVEAVVLWKGISEDEKRSVKAQVRAMAA